MRANAKRLRATFTRRFALATVLSASVALSDCAVEPLTPPVVVDTQPQKSEVTVQVLYAAGPTGGHSEQKISVQPSDDGKFSLDVSEDEVSGVGDMIRAAAWNAVTVATMLTGASLSNSYRFELSGHVDGPSAGGLTTAAVLSLMTGWQNDSR